VNIETSGLDNNEGGYEKAELGLLNGKPGIACPEITDVGSGGCC
jgi:hypothetical protein